MTRTLTLPLSRATYLAQAVLPHVSTDDVTPVLTVAAVLGDALVATDRFSVASVLLSRPRPSDAGNWTDGQRKAFDLLNVAEQAGAIEGDDLDWSEAFLIPRRALARMAALGAKEALNGVQQDHRVIVREEFTPWREAPARTVGSTTTKPYRTRDRFVIVELVHGGVVEWSQRFTCPSGNFPPVARLLEQWKPADGTGPVSFGLMGANLDKVTKFAGRHQPIRVTAGHSDMPKLAPVLLEVGDDFRALMQPTTLVRW